MVLQAFIDSVNVSYPTRSLLPNVWSDITSIPVQLGGLLSDRTMIEIEPQSDVLADSGVTKERMGSHHASMLSSKADAAARVPEPRVSSNVHAERMCKPL